MPSLTAKYQEKQFKTAYKKAYSDLSQVVTENIAYGNFPFRNAKFDNISTNEEWNKIKEKFKVIKDCSSDNAFDCWVDADRVCTGYCNGSAEALGVPNENAYAFIDASGRSWAQFSHSENIYLVDTNGQKGPNLFGKDRWLFTFADKKGDRINTGIPAKVQSCIMEDYTEKNNWCSKPPCYYYSWLYD